ncbi:MAG: hypothetical protein ACLUCE_08015 [Streptococcus sp.]|uniref:hypothetical protein n=1 Tax=Streptococcus sp. TaxID=1306 RepID=UPI0039948395
MLRQVHRTSFRLDSFDKILVDAPCSGIGLIRRKPDIKYNKELQDFESLYRLCSWKSYPAFVKPYEKVV